MVGTGERVNETTKIHEILFRNQIQKETIYNPSC